MGGGTMQTYLALAARHRVKEFEKKHPDVVAALAEEEAELKRARIMNGAEPGYRNGEPYTKPKRRNKKF